MNQRLAIGTDIGGTHITSALINLDQRKIIPSSVHRMHVNAAGSPQEIIDCWSNCISLARQDLPAEHLCIAMPGPFDYEAGISLMLGQAKYESLYRLNVKELLAAALSCRVEDIFMVNDAACFLQGEMFNGGARDHSDKTVIGITLGTGLGSAVYKDGISKNADMWRSPFRDGIAEDYLCTRWFIQRWYEMTGEKITGVKELGDKENTDGLFAEFAHQLATFLSAFLAETTAETVVIGGNIAKAFDVFGPSLTAALRSEHPGVSIIRATLGEEASLLGAVSSWVQTDARQPLF